MKWEDFTRCFVETVEEVAIEKYGDHSKFARAAWPDYKNPPVLWRTIRNGRTETGVRDIYTKDMIGMANALGERLSSLVFTVEEKLRNGWTPSSQGSEKKSTRKSGGVTEVPQKEIGGRVA